MDRSRERGSGCPDRQWRHIGVHVPPVARCCWQQCGKRTGEGVLEKSEVSEREEAMTKELIEKYVAQDMNLIRLAMINGSPTWPYQVAKRFQRKFGIKMKYSTLVQNLQNLEKKGYVSSQLYGKNGNIYEKISEGWLKTKLYENIYPNFYFTLKIPQLRKIYHSFGLRQPHVRKMYEITPEGKEF